ncbi:TPA: dihydrolipoyl dehydrogenase [Candidatus Woesearchaeota archaeon]|nr:dihydrolipoyl dehydrogenase [Candidatus Woesearchaeota archaeon]
MKSFDLVVIGAGSGLDVAVGAAQHGLKTAIINEGPLGGTCLNRGCIPSKMILHSADVAETISTASQFGINATIKSLHPLHAIQRATSLVDHEAKEIEKNINSTKNPVIFKGKASFVNKTTLLINNETITAKKILIAAGTRPSIPPIPGIEKVPFLTSTEALRLQKIPKTMTIIGGGYIAAELGYFFASMGCIITILQRNELLIPTVDIDVARTFTTLWQKKYRVITKADVKSIEKRGDSMIVHYQVSGKKAEIKSDTLLVAAGRKPNSDILNVQQAGLKTSPQGYLNVNQYLETNVKNIWALGDIAGVYQFKHSANLEAEYALQNILGKKGAVDYYPMPYAIFTSPQVAGVGLTEQVLQQKKKSYVVGKYFYKDTGMGTALAEKDGFVKFIVDKKTKEILGCHIIGPQASLLIHEVVVAMKANRFKALDILRNTVHVHPALNEVVQRAAWNVPV